jgi:MtN3 and saliva related transmembrane protein
MVELIGYTAGFLMASTMIPQIIRSLKTKSVEDISIYMLLIYMVSSLLWTIYGISIQAMPVAIADGFALLVGITQFFIKLKYQKKP